MPAASASSIDPGAAELLVLGVVKDQNVSRTARPWYPIGAVMRTLVVLALVGFAVILIRALVRPRALPAPPGELDDSASDDAPEYDGSEELTAVVSSPDPIAIEAYRGALHSAGIPTVVFDEASSRMLGQLPGIAMRVMVPVSRIEDARAVIDDLEPGTFSDVDES